MPDIDMLQKDDALIHQIYVTMRLFTKNLNEVMTPYEVYSSEWTIINYLHHHAEISQADLAAALQIEAAAVSKTIGKMEAVFSRYPRKNTPGYAADDAHHVCQFKGFPLIGCKSNSYFHSLLVYCICKNKLHVYKEAFLYVCIYQKYRT